MTILVRDRDGGTAVAPPTGGLWVCSICGHVGPWTDEHQWYGSLADIDGGGLRMKKPRPIVVACTAACRDRAKELGLVE